MLKAYCTNCLKSTEFFIDPLRRDSHNNIAWGDIICKECRIVMLTLSTNDPGEYEVSFFKRQF